MNYIIKHYKKLIRFLIPMVMTIVLCIALPTFAKNPNFVVNSTLKVENKSALLLENQGRSHYQQGHFYQAAKLFLQASQAYKAASDPIRQALSLSNLSLCYQQLGNWENATSVITESIILLESSKNTSTDKFSALAQSLDIQGGLQLTQGKTNAALQSWKDATAIYTQLNKPKLVLASQTKQAQALQNLGLYRRAIPLLVKALNLSPISTSNDEQFKTQLKGISASPETVTALRILGDSLRVVGKFEQAEITLQRSLDIAKSLQLPDAIALAQLSLGNNTRTQLNSDHSKQRREKTLLNTQEVLTFYEQAATSTSTHIRVQARLNQLSLLADSKLGLLEENKYQHQPQILLSQVQQEINPLPPSPIAIQARINLAHTMMAMQEKIPTITSYQEIAQILTVAVQQAKTLGNPRTLSYAWGSLGNVYEKNQEWAKAQQFTEQALQLAQQVNADDIAYIWQWQLGRVTQAQGNTKSVIAAYKEAVGTIKSLRADLAAANPDVQFSFKNAIEPIHREFVSLLVKSNQQSNLKTARDVIEGLQLVELDNFFRQACLKANPKQIDNVDEKAAIIYPIILEDQLAIIASLPKPKANSQKQNQRDFRYYKTDISSDEIKTLVSKLRKMLKQPSTVADDTIINLQQMYNLVIRPEAEDLKTSGVKTLVFVLDGVLRNIPMAALHDGEKYLIEDYSIALTPGLQLLAPQSFQQQPLIALVGGLSKASKSELVIKSKLNLSDLPHVKKEVKKVESIVAASQVLSDEKFTNRAFQSKVSTFSFPIVHLATHGKFGSTAEETFIASWDDKINVNDLSSILKTAELSQENSLELLVLSACETATGDERSALGLAGVAVRSGARSTVATLWLVNDEASATLMSSFYDQLVKSKETGISKAEALQRAQIDILKQSKYRSPYYWAAYLLLGNWT